MPKATPKDTEVVAVEKPKRAPRKRVARPKKEKAEKPETVAVAGSESEEVVTPTPKPRARRKAPTKVMKEEVTSVPVVETEAPKLVLKTIGRKSIYVYAGVVTASFIAAAVIGYSDEGQINISQAVEMHNAALMAGSVASAEVVAGGQSSETSMVIPVQTNTSSLPNGGLIPSGALPPPPVVEEVVASSTATSSDAIASSTEAVATSTPPSTDSTETAPVAVSNETVNGE